MRVLFLLVSFVAFSQNKSNCIKESVTQNNYYSEGYYLLKGYSHGDINFEVEIDYAGSNDDIIAFFVFEKNNGTKKPLKGVNCNKICPINEKLDKFKIKKSLSISDENGKIILKTHAKKLKFFSINFPGFNPIVFDYKKIVDCKKSVITNISD